MNPYIRKSMLKAFLDCPKKYELMFVKKVPFVGTFVMHIGRLFHEYARDFFAKLDYDRLVTLNDVTDRMLQDKVKSLMLESVPTQPIVRELCHNFVDFEASRWIKLVMMYEEPLEYYKPVAIELYVSAPSEGIEGTVDRIDRLSTQNYVNIEYKTTSKLRNYDVRKELAFYNIMLNSAKVLDRPITHIGYYNPRINKWFCEPMTRRLMQNTRRKILQFKQALELQNFPKNEGFYCAFCPVLRYCMEEET